MESEPGKSASPHQVFQVIGRGTASAILRTKGLISNPVHLPASLEHPLGTTSFGQDIFWFLVIALRNSILLGVSVSCVTTFVAGLLGLVAGYVGGPVDRGITALMDTTRRGHAT